MNLHAWRVVRENSKLGALLLLSFCFFACANPSPEDKVKLAEIEQYFGDRYIFTFEDYSYIHAVLKKGAQYNQQDGEQIFILFRFEDFPKRKLRSTAYINLNMYNSEEYFLFQVGYDSQSQKVIRRKTEHY